jgi:hypothetical protein
MIFVITVGVGTTNLALGKPATQSSTYLHAVFAVAGYAVDGNTGCDMKVLLISVGAEVCFIGDTNLVVA